MFHHESKGFFLVFFEEVHDIILVDDKYIYMGLYCIYKNYRLTDVDPRLRPAFP
jgi:hypothetical protein